ncbi:MAG: hypothetical protein METHP_00849 [Methanoregula sp. SKADARSKE-2]|nr:MAG: hypothetical protein METHP_00849 [Methanoregula sp. SKADARSKE-2]
MDKGIYCLVLATAGTTVRTGALGEIVFPEGWYVYVGSALGTGGLKRLDRHVTLFRDRNKSPKWHIDHLLLDPGFTLEYTVSAATGYDLECLLAQRIGEQGIRGFGCSDCSCTTHLFFRERDPKKEIITAFKRLMLAPAIQTINTRGV